MDTDRARRALAIFSDARQAAPEQRMALVEQRCGDDRQLLDAVKALLAADTHTAALLKTDRIAGAVAGWIEELADPLGDVLLHPELDEDQAVGGRYRILRVIGQGGMGAVYEAEQDKPRRRVAIKAIRPGRVSRQMLRRFEYEAALLARLQHPGIAQVYEADTQVVDQTVQAYIAMELVDGRPIDEFARVGDLNLEARLRLFVKVCDAVQHAHQVGIIHRDLKPANILVTPDAQPKILDFGVARAFITDDSAPTAVTEHDQLVGTLAYMSPEQISGALDLNVQTDVYSLGVLLFRLLTGRMPIDISSDTLPQAARRICEQAPRTLRGVDRAFELDLDRVVARALEKERERRYRSADALARDIERYLAGEPVEARRDSRLYLVRKVLWRHRVATGVAAAFLIGLSSFAVYASRQAVVNRALATAAEQALHAARAAEARAAADAERLRSTLYYNHIGYAQAALRDFDAARVRSLLRDCPPDLRGWEWRYLNAVAESSLRHVRLAPETVRSAQCGEHYAVSGDGYGDVRVTNLQSLQSMHLPWRLPNAAITALAPDEALFAAGSPVEFLRVGSSETGQTAWELSGTAPRPGEKLRVLRWLGFSPDGRRVLAAGDDGRVTVRSVTDGALERVIEVGPTILLAAAVFADGQRVAVASVEGEVSVWSLRDGASLVRRIVLASQPRAVAVHPDGSLLCVTGANNEHLLLSAETLDPAGQAPVIPVRSTAAAFSPDGQRLVLGGVDGSVRIVGVAGGTLEAEYVGHDSGILSIDFSTDSASFRTTSSDGVARWWRSAPPPAVVQCEAPPVQTLTIAVNTDQDAWTISSTGAVCRVDPQSGVTRSTALRGTPSGWNRLTVSPDGRFVIISTQGSGVQVWDAASETLLAELPLPSPPSAALAVSPDSRLLAAGDATGLIRLWNLPELTLAGDLQRHRSRVLSLTFDRQGRLASASDDGGLHLWNTRDGTHLATLRERGRLIYRVLFSPDNQKLVMAGEDLTVQLLEAATGAVLTHYSGHIGAVLGATFHPDGKLLVTGGADRGIRLWRVGDGQEILTLRGHDRIVQSVEFTPDGQTLISTSDDGTIRLWRSTPPPATTDQAARLHKN